MRAGRFILDTERLAIHRLRRRRRAGLTIIGIALSVAAASVIANGNHAVGLAFGLIGGLVGLMVVAGARRDPRQSGGRPGMLSVGGSRLEVIQGATRRDLAADDLESGWIEDGDDKRLVLKTHAGEVIEAEIGDKVAHAQTILGALGLDARAVRMTCGAATASGRSCATGCAYVLVLFGLPWAAVTLFALWFIVVGDAKALTMLFVSTIVLGFTGLMLWVAVNALASADIAIGSDGVHVQRLWRKRFVPYGRLDDVIRRSDRVVLEMGDSHVEIPCQSPVVAELLVERVSRALDAWQHADRADDLAALDRHELDWSEWKQRMQLLTHADSAYRARALRRDDLWRVVEDPAADPQRRVGAALALSTDARSDDRERLRIAADGCAEPSLRIAITGAAEGELEGEAIDEAIAVFARRT